MKRKNKNAKKLTLNARTVRELDSRSLTGIRGGAAATSPPTCAFFSGCVTQ